MKNRAITKAVLTIDEEVQSSWGPVTVEHDMRIDPEDARKIIEGLQ